MNDLQATIEQGHYARHQLFSPNKLIAWSHRCRFATAVRLAHEFAGKRVLDYGCGDGTFLALTMMASQAPALGVGAELARETVDECRLRYRDEPRLQFAEIADLGTVDHLRAFDAVFCMEVLEHAVEWEPVFDRFQKLLTPAGKLVVSVPVETGLPLIVKQTVRRFAGWCGVGYYPGSVPYSMRELARAVAAGRTQHMTRPTFDHRDGPFHHHKGFNWMVLEARLNERFILERVLASPFAWLGPHLATQAWFVARLRPAFGAGVDAQARP
jgi:SAM-dependent methyltransferase